MRRSIWAIPAVVLAAWGCGPPEIVPVVPPGMEYRQVVPEEIPEGEAAQALGETRNLLTQDTTITPAEPTEVGQSKTIEGGLTYETLQPGTGEEARPGQTVEVHYTGTLEDGTVFDSSREANRPPLSFRLGAGQVIPGWDLGVTGMRVGERRKLTIPSELAYGANPPPGSKIPPNATLIFDVELLKVQ